jgi:chemotaxis protein methyltransferase CheR
LPAEPAWPSGDEAVSVSPHPDRTAKIEAISRLPMRERAITPKLTRRSNMDSECVAFLQWALPRLGLRWEGFRRVRAQVCKRIARRMRELGASGFAEYRERLAVDPLEWSELERHCRVTISRFYRDRRLFDRLASEILPALAAGALARGDRQLRVWSAGCGAGEEPYTLALLWRFRLASELPELGLSILGTDADEHQIERARVGCYRPSSLRELPADLRLPFARQGDDLCIEPEIRQGIELRIEDLRRRMPDGCFDLVLCRNLAFTYFAEPVQREIAAAIGQRLRAGGFLVLGKHERLPPGQPELEAWSEADRIHRRLGAAQIE